MQEILIHLFAAWGMVLLQGMLRLWHLPWRGVVTSNSARYPDCQSGTQALIDVTELRWCYLAPCGSFLSVFCLGVVMPGRVWLLTQIQNQSCNHRISVLITVIEERLPQGRQHSFFLLSIHICKAKDGRDRIWDLESALHCWECNQVSLVNTQGELCTAGVMLSLLKF